MSRGASGQAARAAVSAALASLLLGCGGGTASNEAPSDRAMSEQAALGELIFKDASLSASGRQSCASCHVESKGHAPDNALPAQLGGPLLDQQGGRNTPSARYLAFNTAFFFDAEGAPTGGFFWDGRAASLQAQAHEPFLNPREMANTDAADVVARLSRTPYAEAFKRVYGDDILSRPADAFDRIALAVQRYQLEEVDFRPFSSQYDEFLRGNAQLSAQEQRGLALFNSPAKGNCAACHPSAKGRDGSHPLFTDFTYDNLGIPRNDELVRNADPAFFDLGLCARPSGDLVDRADLCGAFKVPSLRNVALRQAFFHNGRFKTLKETLTFYVQRDTDPAKWYPLKVDGSVDKFNDLPDRYKANVNTTEAPYNRQPGDLPALSDAEIDDVIAFLRTLNDGFVP
jgi:cytochrome c peroxidase